MTTIQRPARTHEKPGWPWEGRPWPWCWLAEREDRDGTVHEAVPHDAHMVNEGNTMCPGVPGLVEEEVPELAPAVRRTWSFPEPPDETVTALRSGADNSLWKRDGERWRYAGRTAKGVVATTRSWPELLMKYGPLYDATNEVKR